jgi:hypothetical protein
MSLYHDTLLAKVAQNDPKYKPLIPTSLHTRYTRAWSDKNPRYKWAARALELIRFTELLVEMGLRRKVSSQNKWRAIVSLEVLKCVFDKRRAMVLLLTYLSGPSFGLSYCELHEDLFLLPRFPSVILTQLRYPLLPTLHHLLLRRHPPLLLLRQRLIISRTITCPSRHIRSLDLRRLLLLICLWKNTSFRKLSPRLQ